VIKLGLGLRHQSFDLLVDLRNEVPTHKDIVLMYLLKPRHVLGFNREKYPIFDVSIPEDFSLNKHAAHRNLGLLKTLGVDCSAVELRYDVVIPAAIEQPVQQFLSTLPHRKTLLINLKGEGPYRCMSAEQVETIVQFIHGAKLEINIVLSAKPGDMANLQSPGVIKSPFSDYLSAVALVKNADCIVSPDTSIVHAAAAFDKPLLALYTKDKTPVYLNSQVWGPNNSRARQVISHDDAVYSIAPDLVVTELSKLLTE
jgi:heptosyltransferase-4